MSLNRNLPPRFGFAVLLILLGMFLLLDRLDFYDFGDLVRTWWPLILIYISISQLMNPGRRNRSWSYILMTVGVVFLLVNLDVVDSWEVRKYWPVIFLVIGVYILIDSFRRQNTTIHSSENPSENYIRSSNVFTGTNHSVHSNAFEGGQISAIFGGAEIDLRNVQLAPNATLDLTCVFGGVTLYVPQDWNVVFIGSPVFGGFSDSRFRGNVDPNKVFKITGLILFGGAEIKM